MNYSDRVASLKKEKDALILAHNYCLPEVQDIADHVGDSLGLSLIASETDRSVIVFCGVTFMAESAKVLNPSKTVLMPEPEAFCPMASMCTSEQLKEFRKNNPDVGIAGYVNSTASSKTEMDMCCTSSNAVKAVASMPQKKVLFVPDKNLGSYVAGKLPDKDIILWDGYCPLHQAITVQQVSDMKKKYPKAVVLAHPECRSDVLDISDHIGSTEFIYNAIEKLSEKDCIIVTEIGMKHRLEKRYPKKRFHFIEHAACHTMKMTDVRSVIRCLENTDNEVVLSKDVIKKANVPLKRMIEIK